MENCAAGLDQLQYASATDQGLQSLELGALISGRHWPFSQFAQSEIECPDRLLQVDASADEFVNDFGIKRADQIGGERCRGVLENPEQFENSTAGLDQP